jgi:ABC-2 type transport system permease protein
MAKLIWSTIWERKWPVLIYCASSVILLFLYISLYPSLQSQMQSLNQLMATFPKGVLTAFGITNLTNFTLESLLVSKQFGLVWPLLAGILGISLAGNDLAREIEQGTIEFLLAQPISRAKLYWSRFIAEISALIVFAAVSTLPAIPIAMAFHVDYIGVNYFKLFLVATLFAWAIYSMSMFFSALFSTKGRVYGVMSGIVVAMYVAFLLSTLENSLDKLKYFSFFHYFTANVLIDGKFDWLAMVVFSATIIVFTILGLIIFKRRDIAIT